MGRRVSDCKKSVPLPETNIALENQWLLSFWEGLFSGATLVLGTVSILDYHVYVRYIAWIDRTAKKPILFCHNTHVSHAQFMKYVYVFQSFCSVLWFFSFLGCLEMQSPSQHTNQTKRRVPTTQGESRWNLSSLAPFGQVAKWISTFPLPIGSMGLVYLPTFGWFLW